MRQASPAAWSEIQTLHMGMIYSVAAAGAISVLPVQSTWPLFTTRTSLEVVPDCEPTASTASTTSWPSATRPKTTCFPSSHEVLAVHRKNCAGGGGEDTPKAQAQKRSVPQWYIRKGKLNRKRKKGSTETKRTRQMSNEDAGTREARTATGYSSCVLIRSPESRWCWGRRWPWTARRCPCASSQSFRPQTCINCVQRHL